MMSENALYVSYAPHAVILVFLMECQPPWSLQHWMTAFPQ
jgi:hypothetical protein